MRFSVEKRHKSRYELLKMVLKSIVRNKRKVGSITIALVL